jgi:polysaccharide export outer membrane protein
LRRNFVSTGFLLLSLALAACAPSYYSPYFDVDPNAPYTLASGDRPRIIVFGQDSLSNSYSVDGSGHITMPLIGSVVAEGETTAELGHEIDARLRDGFIRDPHVSVEVEAFRPFFGEVTTPGQYPYVNGMTAETAVAIAGGFTPRAYKETAQVTRVIYGRPVTGVIPITRLIRPGDTMVISERYF